MVGRDKQNMFSVNFKITLQGGDRYAPVDEVATLLDPDREVQYDETKGFFPNNSHRCLSRISPWGIKSTGKRCLTNFRSSP